MPSLDGTAVVVDDCLVAGICTLERAVLNGALVVQSATERAALDGGFVGHCIGDGAAGAFQGAVVLNGA